MQVSELTSLLQESDRGRSEVQDRLVRVQTDMESLTAQLVEAESRSANATKSNATTEQQLNEMQAQIEVETKQKLALNAKIRQLESEKESLHFQVEDAGEAKLESPTQLEQSLPSSFRSKKPWLLQEPVDVITLRRQVRLRREMKTNRHLNGVRNKLTHRDLKSFADPKSDELQEAVTRKDVGAAYKLFRDLSGQRAPLIENVLSVDGVLLEDIVSKLSSFFNVEKKQFSVVKIQNDVKELKNRKTPGTCGISTELRRNGGGTIP
ncbi:hypothetical protein QYM36_002028 [Artemia franciscana]|uniref:Myosin tail domain-containing protein n=1 Tax=Artemia franciscana TaxID=6661 RepID=A0AA88IAK8_ARTSF|nr:hypothetical protein QYM36_002028 [Artemia franciscana]